MPWPCSVAAVCSASASEAKTLHASAAAATRSTHTLDSLIPCRALRRAASVCSLAWSSDVLPGGVVLPKAVGMRPKCDAEGNRAKVMSTDTVLMSKERHHFLRYHLLGVLCWLYPPGYPRILTNSTYILGSLTPQARLNDFFSHMVSDTQLFYLLIILA